MGKTSTYANQLLDHIFRNADLTLLGDAAGIRGSVGAGSIYISLHIADPGDAGNQTTSEVAYTGYARVAVARTSGAWAAGASKSTNNLAAILFPPCTGLTPTASHIGVGTDVSGAGKLLYKQNLGTLFMGAFSALASTDFFTAPGHTFVNDDRVAFYPVGASALPTGITEGTLYFIVGVSGNTFQASLTQGGGAINLTADGDGIVFRAATLAISSGITPEIPIAGLVVTEE